MNRQTSLIALLALLAALSWSAVVPAQSKADLALRAAIETEEVKGDCKKAIEQYRTVASDKDRAIAAQALLRMANCYRLLGDAEARRVYERIVNDFRDQKGAVAIARAQLNLSNEGGEVRPRLALAAGDFDLFYTSVSADGRSLASVYYPESGGKDVVIRDLVSGSTRTVAEMPKGYLYSPVFAPDGKQLAFQACPQQCEVRVIALQERGIPKARTIYSGRWADTMGWTPDSKSIVVFRTFDDKTSDIAILAAADGAARVLTSNPSNYSRMFVSPDGRYLGLDHKASSTDERFDIFIMPMAGGAETRVVDHPAEERLVGWSPDGQLLFTSDRSTGTSGLYALKIVDGRPEGTPRLLYADVMRGTVLSYGVTRSGTLFYSDPRNASGYREIQTASIDFATGAIGTPTTIGGERVGSNESPAWSRDGKTLAYVSTVAEDVPPLLVIHDTGTGTSREVRTTLRRIGMVKWFADGRSLLAYGFRSGISPGIYRIDAQTGEATLLVAGAAQAALSPDGGTLYYKQGIEQKGTAFIARDLASGRETELLRRQALGNVNLSPDGRYIATGIIDNTAGTRTLVAVPTSGGEPIVLRVNKPAGAGGVPMWMPDSRGVIASDGAKLWRVSLDGTQSLFLDHLPAIDQMVLRPDGTRIAFTKTIVAERANQPGVYMLENLFSTRPSR